MSHGEDIRVECNGPVMTITMDRPDVLNALDPPAHRKLAEAFDRYGADDDLRVAILTGAGEKAFCVGSDLKVRADMGGDDMPETGFGGIAERFDLTKPVIAAVNGHAIGGGLEMVLACDLAIAVPNAKFGLPEVRVGLAASGGLHRLARQLPMKHATEIALSGQLFSAEKALEYGLVNRVVDTDALMPTTIELANVLLAGAPMALRATKQMMLDGLGKPSLAAAFGAEYPEYEAMLSSEDAIEGSAAFLENRKPIWKNR
ncbi:MAG: enoyl-CoA hydratase [Rhodospirillaceae bacterium]|jgi:enoyl-CoA hydratase/carnithine racemase|nr:enoyl-CoA hydratase [Rhodospirillaceae bacterium]